MERRGVSNFRHNSNNFVHVFCLYGLVFPGTLATRRLLLPSFPSEEPFFSLFFLLISVEFCLKERIIESTNQFQQDSA